MITLDENYENIDSDKLLFSGYKPVIALAQSPDGYIYFSTINSLEKILSVNPDVSKSSTTDEIRPISIIIILIMIITLFSWLILKRRKLKR